MLPIKAIALNENFKSYLSKFIFENIKSKTPYSIKRNN